MKLLVDYFGDRIDDDFFLDVPDGFMALKYQWDAVSQGYRMMKKYGGFFLADVVGLGKNGSRHDGGPSFHRRRQHPRQSHIDRASAETIRYLELHA